MNKLFSVEGKTFLVTGGTRGIGKAIASELIRNGAKVIANYVRDSKNADLLLNEFGNKNLIVIRADLTREKGMEKLVDELDGVNLDGLIHAAATGVHAPVTELNLRHWDWTMNLNVRAFFELIIKLKNNFTSNSSVIALSSEGAVNAVTNYSIVGSSKAALESLCRHMAVEMVSLGIRFNVLSPGSVLTDAWDAFPNREERINSTIKKIPGGQMTTLEEVASVALFLCSDMSRGINGQTIVVDKGERIVS